MNIKIIFASFLLLFVQNQIQAQAEIAKCLQLQSEFKHIENTPHLKLSIQNTCSKHIAFDSGRYNAQLSRTTKKNKVKTKHFSAAIPELFLAPETQFDLIFKNDSRFKKMTELASEQIELGEEISLIFVRPNDDKYANAMLLEANKKQLLGEKEGVKFYAELHKKESKNGAGFSDYFVEITIENTTETTQSPNSEFVIEASFSGVAVADDFKIKNISKQRTIRKKLNYTCTSNFDPVVYLVHPEQF
jgi:hypothetical protein